jgi:DNA-directed RNA polymerase specialized sigma24 family protein
MVTAARPNDLLHTHLIRVLGIAYQALGDAALATEATEACFKRLARQDSTDTIYVWHTLVKVLYSYIGRGIHVELLDSNATGWQASLLDGLAELTPYERVLLLLHYHEHLSFDQLAMVMDDDVDAIRDSVAQVRQQLIKKVGLDDPLC